MASDFDNSVFSSVCEVMGERFSSLEESYIKNTEKYISDIESFMKLNDLDNIKKLAHPLKSSSASLGFSSISEVAAQIESLSNSGGDFNVIKELIHRLPSEFDKVKEFLANNKKKSVQDAIHKNIDNPNPIVNRIKVMHIDDDPVICKITRAYLCNTGLFETKTFLSVDEALANSQEFTPDIILVDFMMPDTEGVTSLLDLKADPRLSNIPVVFVTGLDQKDVKEKLGKDIISGYLKKPYSAETLISLIKDSCRLDTA